jgi:hypothetical protein
VAAIMLPPSDERLRYRSGTGLSFPFPDMMPGMGEHDYQHGPWKPSLWWWAAVVASGVILSLILVQVFTMLFGGPGP